MRLTIVRFFHPAAASDAFVKSGLEIFQALRLQGPRITRLHSHSRSSWMA